MSLTGTPVGSGMKDSSSSMTARFCLELFARLSNSSSLLDRLYFFSTAAAKTKLFLVLCFPIYILGIPHFCQMDFHDLQSKLDAVADIYMAKH